MNNVTDKFKKQSGEKMNTISTEIAVIVLNYNNYPITIKCVENLINIGIDCNIVVVDNCSTNDSFQKIYKHFRKYKNIAVIKSNRNGGYSSGNNIGIRYILNKYKSLKYIAIMNSDVILCKRSTLIDLIQLLEKEDNVAAATTKLIENGEIDISRSGWYLPSLTKIIAGNLLLLGKIIKIFERLHVFEEKDNIRYVEAVHGSFFVIKIEKFESVGLFDENVFMYYEENILGKRLTAKGYRLAVNLSDCYLHNHKYHEMSLKQAQNTALRMKASQLYFLKEYFKCNTLVLRMVSIINDFYIYVELPFIKKLVEIKNMINKKCDYK